MLSRFVPISAIRTSEFASYNELWSTEMGRFRKVTLAVLFLSFIAFCGCKDLLHDTQSLLIPRFHRSEIFGFVAGFGTTFAGVPDLLAMFRRRSSAGMNPRMAAIIGVFQILWVYYGLLIVSRPVVAWNLIGVLINLINVSSYRHFARNEKAKQG
jgi:MtN3 and saliva related transmembrane protein